MKIKNIILCDPIENINNISNINLGRTLYVEDYPREKEFAIVAFIEEFQPEKNRFRVKLLNENKELIVIGKDFQVLKAHKNGIGILNHNISLNFETKEDIYYIQLENEEKLVEELKINSKISKEEDYMNLSSIQNITF